MTHKPLAVFLAIGILAFGTQALAEASVRRETPERRPYIVEIGQPYSISPYTLQQEAYGCTGLNEYLEMYGYPDYAEIQEIEPTWPWESYEIRLYFMRRNLELAFGKVPISAAMRNYGILKYRGDIPSEKRHQIEVILAARRVPPPGAMAMSGGLSQALVARLEAAVERATLAAARAETESDAAAQAADRAVTILDRLERRAAPRSR